MPLPTKCGTLPNSALPRIVDDAIRIVEGAIEELVLPGLRHVGVG